jgi:hypothetical protein
MFFLLVSKQRKGNLFLIKEEAFHINLIQFLIKKSYAGLMKLKRKVLFLPHRQIFDLTFSIFITKLSTFLDVFLF